MKNYQPDKKHFTLIACALLALMIFLYNHPQLSFTRLMFYQVVPDYTPLFIEEETPRPVLPMITLGEHGQIIFDASALHDGTSPQNTGLIGIGSLNELITNLTLHTNASAFSLNFTPTQIAELRDYRTLLNRHFSMNPNTGIIPNYLSIDDFLATDIHIEKNPALPQVLIFHTHASSEFFRDSPSTGIDDLQYGIVGVGATLAEILRTQYGLNVLHYQGVYDRPHVGAYERIEPSIRAILEEYPSIELVLDLHRDGIDNIDPAMMRTQVNGRDTARIMFVNGLSAMNMNQDDEPRRLENIPNPYIQENLALSFHLQTAMNEGFPGMSRNTHLLPFRFINHLRPWSALVEVGYQNSTMAEAHNAMEPLAYLLYTVVFAQ